MFTPFLKNYHTYTSKDHPDTLSLIVFINPLNCNFDCYNCHNKKAIKEDINASNLLYENSDHILEKYTLEDFLNLVNESKKLGIELLIISGGEPLFDDSVINFLKEHREKIELPIRIDTNGFYPEKMLYLKENNLVDGFCLDIKIPIKNEYQKDEIAKIEKFLGKKNITCEYSTKFRESVKLTSGMKYSHIRIGYVYYYIHYSKEELDKIPWFDEINKQYY